MIDIDTEDYNKILTAVGYPAVHEDDLEYTHDEIVTYFIQPCVRKYYSWFPLQEIESKQVSYGDFSIDFPSDDVFTALDIRYVPFNVNAGARTSNPLINALYYKNTGRHSYGTGYDYGNEAASYIDKAYNLAKLDAYRAIRFDVDQNARKVTGYSSDVGEIMITWAKMSEDFDTIPLNRKDEVIELCQAELLRAIAMLRSQIDSATGVTLNVDRFEERANNLEERVMNKWKAMAKPVIIRS